MKNKSNFCFTITLFVGILFLFSAYISYNFYKENSILRNSLPYFLKGEKIDYFSLIDLNAKEIDHTVLKENPVSVFFIMSRPCSPCDKNVTFYKKIAQIFENRVKFYGIVLDTPTEALNFADQAKPNFDVYVPKDLNTFLSKMRIKLNMSQLLVYTDKVELVRLGELSGKNVTQAIDFIKGLHL